MKYFLIILLSISLYCCQQDGSSDNLPQEYNTDEIVDSLYEDYYENGNIKFSINLKGNKRDSICKFYYENGNIKSIANYEKGLLNGVCKWFYQSGGLRLKSLYINDKRLGLSDRYEDVTGMQISRTEFVKSHCFYEGYSDDFINREWFFIEGDTNTLSTNSTTYLIKSSDDNLGINLSLYFSSEYAEDGKYDDYFLLLGECDDLDSIRIKTDDRGKLKYKYLFTEEDKKKEYLFGIIEAIDEFENGEGFNRQMFFIWSINEEKLVNNKLSEITEWGNIPARWSLSEAETSTVNRGLKGR